MRKINAQLILFVMSGLLSAAAFAEFRIWEDTAGNVMEGEFVTLSGGLVIVRDQAGKEYNLKPENLSEADRIYLERVVPPKLSLTVTKNTDGGGSKTMEAVKCRASIRQTSSGKYTSELTAVLIVMGEDLKTGAEKVAGRKQTRFTLPDNRGEPIEFESQRMRFRSRSNKSGEAYSGYILVVWDKFGNPVAIETSSRTYDERATRLAKPTVRLSS
jgi:hypothetical protein